LYNPHLAAEYKQTDQLLLESDQDAVEIPAITIHTAEGDRIVHTQKVLIKENDTPAAIVGIVEDVTERIRTLEDLNVRTRAIEASIDPISIADAQAPDMPIVYVNKAFERITGYKAEEVVGTNCRFLQGDDRDQPALDELRAAIREQRSCVVELRNYRKNGEMFWNQLEVSPVFNDAGELTHFIGIQNDVTSRKEAEARLTAALQETEALFAFTSQLNTADTLEGILHAMRSPFVGSGMLFASLFTIETNAQNEPEWIQLSQRWSKPHAPQQPDDLRFHVPSYPGGAGWVQTPNQPFIIEDTLDLSKIDEATSQVYQQFNTRSTITLPLKASDRWVGLITFFWENKQTFDERDRAILSTMATQAAVAMNNILLFAETQEALTETRIMNQISQALTTAEDLNQAIGDLLSTLHKDRIALNATQVALSAISVNERGQPASMELIAWWGEQDQTPFMPLHARTDIDNVPLYKEWSAFPLKPIFIEDEAKDSRLTDSEREQLITNGIHAAVIIPLANAGRWVGLLIIGWNQAQRFSQQTRRIYQTLMIQTPSAFENRYLFNRTEATLRETATLYEITQALNSNESLDEGLTEAVETLHRNSFLPELASATLYRLETDQAGEPDWSEVVAHWAATPQAVADTEIGSRLHLPDHRFNRLWLDAPSEPTYISNIATDERLTEINRADFSAANSTAVVIIPLLIGGRWVGQLTLTWHTPRNFRVNEKRLLRGLASQIAATLDNRILFDQTNQALRETRTINRINKDITQADNMEEVLINIHTTLNQANLATDSHRIVFYNLRTNTTNQPIQATIVSQWLAPDSDITPLPTTYDLREDTLASLWRNEPTTPLIIEDSQTEPRLPLENRQRLHQNQMGALVVLPLNTAGRWVGLITIDWPTTHPFSPADRALFNTLLPQLSTGFANQQLFDQAQRRATQLETVARVSTVSASILNEQDMLQAVAELAKRSFSFYHTHIYLINETHDTLILAAGAGPIGQKMLAENHRIPLNHPQSLVARSARTRQSQILSDTADDTDYLPHPLLKDTRSAMALPMVSGDSLLGVLNIQSDIPQNFDDEDVRIQNTLATQIAIALQNIRSFESSEKTRQELSVLARRLARTGWEDYLREKQTRSNLSFAYDRQRVVPLIARDGHGEHSNNKETTGLLTNGHSPTPENGNGNGNVLARVLRVQGQPIGRLALDTPEELTDEADDIMSAVAANLSAHIENLRLTEQTQEALQETETLYQFGNKLNAAQSQEEILMAVGELPGANTADVITLLVVEEYEHEPETAVLTAGWMPSLNQATPPEQLGFSTPLSDVPISRLWIENPNQTLLFGDLDDSDSVDPTSVAFYRDLGIQALGIIPLTSRGRVFGLLTFSWFAPQAFTEQTERLFRAINGQISTATNNQILLEQTRIRAALLEKLSQIEVELSQASSPEDIIRTLATNIPDFTGAVSLQHLELNENHEPVTQIPRVMWSHGRLRDDDPRLNKPVPLNLLPTSRLWIENPRDVLYVEDGANDERLGDVGREMYKKLNLGSVALLPLRSGGVWQGTVVFSTAGSYTFTPEQRFIFGRLLESLAAIVASLRALEAQRAALAESEVLYDASVRFNRAETLNDVLQVIATTVSDAGAFSSALWLLETDERDIPQRGTLTAAWRSDGGDPSVPLGTVLDLDNIPGSDYWRYSPQNIMLVSDPKTDPRVKDDANYLAVLDMGGYVASAALPLTISSRWVGVCTIQWKTVFNFDESDMRLYTTLAAQSAVTIDSLLLLQQTQERAAQLDLQARIEAQLSRAVDEVDILHALVD
ncbi:MAG: GAF domain-containing protein, partial [Anaerolineales bacterium]|nr:GAF domain-containing protein [Anaerolineales bacterium]